MRIGRALALRALWDVGRGASRPGTPGLVARLRVIPPMLVASARGQYPHLSRRRLAMMVTALAYLLSPVDVVPELLLAVLGLGDDVLVLAWLAGALFADAEQFIAWRARRSGRPATEARPGLRDDLST
jgi:uncharacterized membrane protein YkvA (DUF1232 family)